MNLLEFPEVNCRVGENQEEYITIPACMDDRDPQVPFTYCVELDATELAQVNNTRRLWLTQLTFGRGFHPSLLSTLKPAKVGPDLLTGPELARPDCLSVNSKTAKGQLKDAAAYLLTKRDDLFPETWSFAQKRKIGSLKGIERLEAAKALIDVEINRLIDIQNQTKED